MLISSADRSLPQMDSKLRTEERVEKLVGDLSHIIRAAEPSDRQGLKDFAESLWQEEISTIDEQAESVKTAVSKRSFNPLAAGILLTILGIGLALIVTPVGLSVVLIGLFLVVWGSLMSWLKK